MSGGSEQIEALPHPQREPPPLVHTLYEELTQTWQYIVADPVTRHAIIIDPHLDNGPQSTAISTIAADRVLAVVAQNGYIVDRILHTHEPTQHPSSAWYIRAQLLQATGRAPHVQIGRQMQAVQRVFKRKYSMNDGTQWRTDFEDSFADGQVLRLGALSCHVLHLARGGHMAFVVGPHVFVGRATAVDPETCDRHARLLAALGPYQVHSARDRAPTRSLRLTTVTEGEAAGKQGRLGGKKLVIRYAAE